ncbi:MAG: hypothetical protein WAL40_02770, partial [Rhodoplanes sp.]
FSRPAWRSHASSTDDPAASADHTQPDRRTIPPQRLRRVAGSGNYFCLGRIFSDPVRYFAVLVEGAHQDDLRGNNFGFVAALEGLKQPIFGVSKPSRNRVESWKVWMVFKVHNRRILRNLGL